MSNYCFILLLSLPLLIGVCRRFVIKLTFQRLYSTSEFELKDILKSHISVLKRSLFSRSLRILPLPDQVAIVESLAFLVSDFPDVLPLSDQHFLAFLSELLKMLSIADGEMKWDVGINIGVAVDKDGFVRRGSPTDPYDEKDVSSSQPRKTLSSAIFLRSEIILPDPTDHDSSSTIIVPAELPMGVQLRVGSLKLFRGLVKEHPASFFESEASTPIGKFG